MNESASRQGSNRKHFFLRLTLATLAGVLLSAPLWAMTLQSILNLHWYSTPDGFWLLGASLAIGLVSALLLPHTALTLFNKISMFFTKHAFLMLCILTPLFIYLLYQINQHILHAFLSSADEHSCYFLAECLLKGKLYAEPHTLSDFFNVVHVGNRDGKWFSVYPLGWPLIWAAGLKFHIVNWLNPILSSISLILFFKSVKRLFNTQTAFWGVLFIYISPFFLFTSASYFSHSTCLFLISVFLYSFLRWRASESEKARVLWAVICTSAIGYGFMTRYLTMAAVAFPFMLYHYWPYLTMKKRWQKAEIIGVVIIIFFFLSIFIHNHLVTGKFYKAPNKYDKSWERLGFSDEYTPLVGLNYIIARIFYLADWCSPVLIALYIASLFQKRNFNALQTIFRFSFFSLAIAYFFYFSWGGNQFGPRYYYESFPFLIFIAIEWVVFLSQHDNNMHQNKFMAGLLIGCLLSTGYLFTKQADYVEESSRQRKSLYELVEKTVEKPALVFISGFLGHRLVMAQEDAVRNSPFLDGSILYAHDRGSENVKLMQFYPQRRSYLGSFDGNAKKPILKEINLNSYS